jgi:hypothetical protein
VAGISSAILELPNSLIERCDLGVRSGYGPNGATVNVVVPTVNVANVSNITNSDISTSALADRQIPVTLNIKASSSKLIREYDQDLTGPVEIAETYMKVAIEEVMRYVNADIGSLFTYANFPNYAPVVGGDNDFTRGNLATAYAILHAAGVPVSSGTNMMTFATHSTVYGNMISDSSFIFDYIVGQAAGDSAQQKALLAPAVGATIIPDPAVPIISNNAYAGLFFHRSAIAVRPATPMNMSNAVVSQTTIYPRGGQFPITLQMWKDPVHQGVFVHAFVIYGRAVVRPECAVWMTTT